MVDAPEKDWVNPHDFETNAAGKVQYVRADRLEALERESAELRAELSQVEEDRDRIRRERGLYCLSKQAAERRNAELEAVFLKHWKGQYFGMITDRDAEEINAALAGSGGGWPVPEGMVLVPVSALKWLNGEGPDANGHWFGDAPDDCKRGAFWWRTKFTAMITAAQEEAKEARDDA